MSALVRLEKIGEGTYGTVYKARQPGDDRKKEGKILAVKRNLKDPSASWIGNARELDILARLKGHPFIVDLIDVSFGDPFGRTHPMTPINELKRLMKDDKVHFVMEYVETPGDRFFGDKVRCTPTVGMYVACQLLLVMEFMHARNITHRDLKPANLLISNDPKENVRLRVCDFGMSQVLCSSEPSTPGVATSWYRAPEVCCRSPNYTISSDWWSIGCILFEIFGQQPYLYAVNDNDTDAFNAILSKAPERPNVELIRKLWANGRTLDINPSIVPDLKELHSKKSSRVVPPRLAASYRRHSFLDQLQMTSQYKEAFKQLPGTTPDQFSELLTGLLQIDPSKRWSPTQALDHPFFNYMREYIKAIRTGWPPVPLNLPAIRIINCNERKWAIAVAFSIYNERARFSWYRHRLIFHAIDLFDRYLEWAFTPGNASLGVMETPDTGRLHSRDDAQLRFWVCLYLIHKFYTTMSYPLEWEAFVPKIYTGPEKERIAEQFEVVLVKEVSQYQIYRDTLLEIIDQFPQYKLTEEFIRALLLAYGQVVEWQDKSIRALFREFMKLPG